MNLPLSSKHRESAASAPAVRLSELFSSLQGEGPSLGSPALFVRLALCNLRCRWCDTRYTWDFERYDYEREVFTLSAEELVARIVSSGARRVIFTGGEPLLQQRALQRVIGALDPATQIEIETNGTLAPEAALLARVNQWNVSPKLAHAGDDAARRIRLEALRALRQSERAFLKFVVESAGDSEEILALVRELDWPAERVCLMPQATSASELTQRSGFVAELCQRAGFRFSPRLHVLLWGGERGR